MTDMKTEERIMGAGSDMNMNTTSLIYVFLKSSRKKFSAAFNEATCSFQYSINLNYFRDSDNAINLEKMEWIKQKHTGHEFKEVNQRNLNKYQL